METNFGIKIGDDGLPFQEFNGKKFRLFPRERYFSRGTTRMHTEVWKFHNGAIPKGFHVHHKDENPWNNAIENLECIEAFKHLSEHSKKRVSENKEWFEDFQKKGIAVAPEWHRSEEGRQWHSEHGKKIWQERESTTKQCEMCQKEYQTKFPSRSKFCHQNCKAKALRARRKGL